MRPYPEWVHILAWSYLGLCFLSTLIISADLIRGHKQKMWIMSLVWPITALYWGPAALWMYFKTRPLLSLAVQRKPQVVENRQMAKSLPGEKEGPDWVQTTVGVFHCGAGCTLGDIVGEWLVFALAWTWAGSAFSTELVTDFIFAYLLGIFFQYFTIAPMRGERGLKGIAVAAKADTISIVAFEIGLFGWMALAYFVIFPNPHLHPDEAVHWFVMQVGMIIGFFTSYPANVLLLKKGLKEKMPQYDMPPHQMERPAA